MTIYYWYIRILVCNYKLQLLIPLTLSFTEQKFLTLMKSLLSIIFHGSCDWYYIENVDIIKVITTHSYVIFQEFHNYALTIGSIMPFEGFFVEGGRFMSMFIYFTCECPNVPAPFVVETIYAPFYYLCSFAKDQLTYFCGSVSGFSIMFHWPCWVAFHQYHTVLITVALYNSNSWSWVASVLKVCCSSKLC